MNIITVAFFDDNSERLIIFPLTVSGSVKSGAFIPNGGIFEGVSAI
jgi:hypothetical protein